MSASHRSLFLGFVLGDDRGQSPEVIEDFRDSGLAHLLVVSGENVAFLLALAAPLLRRLAMVGRLVTAGALLLFFGVLTRWEPSVLRAVAMVAVSLTAWAMGRPVSRLRLLALAVTVLLVVDPLLVRSVGFLLSVGACTGIALLARPLADLIPGPQSMASALAVTVAAQLGVAPVLVPVFGGVPVASFPANLLALPAAGPVMMWGVAAGLPAGLAGGGVANLVDIPTRALIAWIAGVARWGAAAPLGRLTLAHVLVLAALVALGVLVRRRGWRVALLAVGAVVIAQPAVAARAPASAWDRPLGDGARLWQRGGATVVVVHDARPDQLLRAARGAGVRRVDVLVVAGTGRRAADAVRTLVARVPARAVVAPAGSPVGSATFGRIEVPPLSIDVQPGPRGLEALVKRR
jgi:ComEC/Rec2-related protein